MQRGNSIDRVRGHDRQVCHAHVFVMPFLDHRHLSNLLAIHPRVRIQSAQEVEIDAINKLPGIKNKRIMTINLIVVRINKRGELRYSRPCNKCLSELQVLQSRSYRLKYIYYSNENGEIIREKYANM